MKWLIDPENGGPYKHKQTHDDAPKWGNVAPAVSGPAVEECLGLG